MRAYLTAALAIGAAALSVPAQAVAAPAWTAPLGPGGGGTEPAIGVDGDGTVDVAWLSAADELFTASRAPGGSFGAPAQLSAAGAEAGTPALAANAAGGAVAAWVSDTTIETAAGTAGGLAPAGAVPSPGDDPSEVQTGIDGAGRQWFAWLHELPAGSRVRVARRDPGGPIVPVGDVSPTGASEPSLAVAESGAAYVAWVRTTERDGGDTLDTEVVQEDLNTGAEVALANDTLEVVGGEDVGAELSSTQAALTPDGQLVVGWLRDVLAAGGDVVTQIWSNAGGQLAETPASVLTLDAAAGSAGVGVLAWDERIGPAASSVRASTRPSGGAFGAPATLATGGPGAAVSDPRAAVRAGGEPVVSWRREGGALAASVGGDITGAGAEGPALLAPDGEGNVVAAWEHAAAGVPAVRVAAYDAVGPKLTGFSAPARTEVGDSTRFAVTALDTWSGVAGLDWAFGDGGTASGAEVTHTYARSGQFAVSVTGSDGLGNMSSAGSTVAVGEPALPPPPPPPPAAPADTTPPVITGLRPVARCVRSGRAPTFALTLSEDASVRFILRRRQGSPARRRCPAVRGRRPGRGTPVDDRTRQLPAGDNTVAVAARVHRARALRAGRTRVRLAQRRLRPGTYQLIARPTDAAGNRGVDAITKVWVLRRR